MAQGRSHFLVGVFVIAGVLLGAAAIVWLGASKYFQKGYMYVTYFDESVQGLQVDSIVKYRGVDVGTVRRIGVAPDQRLIEVVMKVDVKDFSVSGVVAKLTLAGITGIVYVELDRKKEGESGMTPKGFDPPFLVIPSAPSNIKQIEVSINDILKSIKQIDFKGISDQLMKTAKTIDGFVSGERVSRITVNLGAAAASLASASERIDRLTADGSIDQVIKGARDAVGEAKALIVQLKGEVTNMGISQTTGRIDQAVDATSRKVQSALVEVGQTAETLRRAAESFEILVERLNADPSALIFSKPPKGD